MPTAAASAAATTHASTLSSQAFARAAINALIATLALVAGPRLAIAGAVAGAYGTRDQVRQCVAEQDRLDAQVLQRQQAHEAHVAALAALEAESAEITRREATVNAEDESSVREFNRLVADHNANADKINEQALESRAITMTYNADAASHNQRCAGLLIRPEDLAVIARERARGASSPTSAPPRAVASGVLQTR
jgi:hypothetical protein